MLSPACPSRTVLRHVVDRWTPLVVTVLADGPSRFGQLRARVGGVTPKVLTQTLRSMERDGLVTRTQLPGVPPRVDYELTDLGRSLQAPIDALRTWIEANSARILAHRESYDAVGS
ncbi:HxlR family transcriptional regulator [Actinomyces naeslundii]|nr:HxlR family transcriptional regulator [Actinomyces naeslundii]